MSRKLKMQKPPKGKALRDMNTAERRWLADYSRKQRAAVIQRLVANGGTFTERDEFGEATYTLIDAKAQTYRIDRKF